MYNNYYMCVKKFIYCLNIFNTTIIEVNEKTKKWFYKAKHYSLCMELVSTLICVLCLGLLFHIREGVNCRTEHTIAEVAHILHVIGI